ncbi:response regulator transcription factor [Motilibacter aurantiacus]|uniref:response regulator transcription factor n=1 Tax=Motilibacter aurantiacus TaxID=2714955 RepID=UPI00140D3FA5|nr:response regulator transcription factor [Motilibacter aurantiacus]NHC44952.1 response regulator transcription factor [Motilibacter aurantiacus]
MRGRVLVVDDDETVAGVVVDYLRRAGFDTVHAGDGPSALAAATPSTPGGAVDLVILDVMLPGLDGIEVCRRLRAVEPACPVIMLTALGEEEDRVLGLEVGADDYVTKPFSPRELVLRVESVLRRARPVPAQHPVGPLAGGPVEVDLQSRQAFRHGVELALTVREFDLLAHLLAHPDRAFSREELLAQVWGWTFGDQSTVTVHIRRLREKVEVDPSRPALIQTVWGVGYRWHASGAADPVPSDPVELAGPGQLAQA